MSRHFKDFGASNFGQLFSQLSDNIRSNAEQLVSAALTGEASCRPDPSGQRGTGHPESESSASPSPRRSSARPSSSTSSSQATTPDEIVGNLFSQFSRGGGASSGGSSMGNAGFCGSRHTNTVKPGDPSSSQEAAAMLCDICSTKFTLFNRKKICSECKNYFCGSCVSRETPSGQVRNSTSNSSFNNAPRTCKRCKILLSIPPVRADLMELRVKDLQRYLISKKVNTKSCVEKKDLVELVIRQNASCSSTVPGSGGQQQESSSSSSRQANPAPAQSSSSSRRAPEERQKSFPKAYVESTHRHEWLEKMNENANQVQAADQVHLSCEEDDDDFIVVTPVTPMTSEPQQNESENNKENDPPEEAVEAVEETPIEPMIHDDQDNNEQIDENRSSSGSETEQIGASALPETNPAESKETSEKNDETKSEPINIDQPKENNLDVPNDSSLSMSESPRRFANQGLVYLSEIENVADIQDLSVKQAKDILAMNRVNFKGVVEKDELLKHVSRLWKQEKQAQEDKDAMVDSDLCKICMDNPVDCVMLECGHMCTCTTCGKQMAECPICRQYVVRVVRTFKA